MLRNLAIALAIGALLCGCATGSPSVSGSAGETGITAKATVPAVKF
jgi:uncharacterized protein YceK